MVYIFKKNLYQFIHYYFFLNFLKIYIFSERSQSNSPKKSIEINTRKISTHENIKKINQSPRQSRIFNSDLKNIIIESMTASVRGSSQKKEVFGREKSATIEKKRNSLQNINPINNSSKPRLSGFLQNIKNSNIKINPKKNSENSIRFFSFCF